ncbi:MAG: hypothetical protein IJX47_07500 [Clostridia bacterium]|nr:hypothetical protein [Clostridia bacterium]
MKRVIVLLILAGLLTSLLPAPSAFATAEPESESSAETVTPPVEPVPPEGSETPEIPTEPAPPVTEPLPPETEEPVDYETLLFEALVTAVDGGETLYSLSTPEPLEDDLLQAVCTRVLERVARLFYLQAIDVSIVTLPAPDEEGNLYRYDLRPIYGFEPGEELDAAKAFVEQKTAAILAKIPANTTEMEKVLFLHDYICTTFAYDGTHTVGDLYNLLQSGHGVCQAYVALYAYLLDSLGIANDYAVSDGMNHIWNVVELGGSWYHVDLTWDDPAVDQPGRALHTNFLRSDAGIAETGHHDWIAPYPCESNLYENSVLPDLAGAILFLPDARYAVNRVERALVKLDLSTLTAEPVADLSLLRWEVWEKPESLYKEQYINLFYDGYLIYFNGPDTIWSYDPVTDSVEIAIEHHPSAGYLYSLTGDGHTLTCALSKAPGTPDSAINFSTPHRYGELTGGLLAAHTCLLCGHVEHYLSPQSGSFVTALLSTRSDTAAKHDLRLVLLVNKELLASSPPLNVTLTLHADDGNRSVTTTLSEAEYGDLLVYERMSAGGKEYAVDEDYKLLGLILRELETGSYTLLELSVTADGKTVYQATMEAKTLLPEPPAPPVTEEAPTTDDTPFTGDAPETDVPATSDIPATDEDPMIDEGVDADGETADGASADLPAE